MGNVCGKMSEKIGNWVKLRGKNGKNMEEKWEKWRKLVENTGKDRDQIHPDISHAKSQKALLVRGFDARKSHLHAFTPLVIKFIHIFKNIRLIMPVNHRKPPFVGVKKHLVLMRVVFSQSWDLACFLSSSLSASSQASPSFSVTQHQIPSPRGQVGIASGNF